MCDFRFFPSFCVRKKSPTNRGIEHKDAESKSTDANQVYMYWTRRGKKSVRDVELHYIAWIMYEYISETKTLILMKPCVVVSRFRITKWPTGMPYRTRDYWLPSVVLFLSSIPVFYSRYISRTWLPFTYVERGCWRSITQDKDFLLLLLGGIIQRRMFE